MTIARRLRSMPVRDPARRHDLRRRDERLDLDEQGRVPSIEQSTTEPGAALASATKRADASSTSTSPPARISKTPTSLVAPNRFLSARSVRKWRSRSPSKKRTQSTRCSRTRGPATAPSFVTCPTRITAQSRRLAASMIAVAASRTWPTEPGAPVIPSACIVWIESITQACGRSASSVATTCSSEVSATAGTSSAAGPGARRAGAPGRPTPRPRRRARSTPAAARLPSAMPVIVDLPIPGSPPSSTSEPGTSPPPSTRSSSSMPVRSRAHLGRRDVAKRDRLRPPRPARRAGRSRPTARAPAPSRPGCSTRRIRRSGPTTRAPRARRTGRRRWTAASPSP